MNATVKAILHECTKASDDDALSFPEILGKLGAAGVESYLCDLRRATKTYYLPDGQSVEIAAHPANAPIAQRFSASGVADAVGQSQRNEHSYRDFCRKIAGAGCAGYIVTLLGRRPVYFGRDGETHVEYFPGGK